MSTETSFNDISENLDYLDDWEDRYKYLIELGEGLASISDTERTENNKVNGCVSQVWLCSNIAHRDGKTFLSFRGDSDAMIVKGLVAILIAFYSDQSTKWIVQNDAIAMFDKLGLREHLTSQRSNGLIAMVARIRAEAKAAD